MKCCVYTRFVYEVPYIESFIDHYLKLGFDKIIILYHDIQEYILPNNLIEDVEIINVENNGNKLLNEYKYLLINEYDWVLNVDSDEFLLLDKNYNNIHDFVRSKLIENANINIFQFSWAWLHVLNPPSHYTLSDLIENYKLTIGSKNEKTQEIWVKSMTKVTDIEYITCHSCILKKSVSPLLYVNGIILDESLLIDNYESDDDEVDDEDYEDERKNSYENVKLLPRAYIFNEDTYSESVLIHINTRNVVNAFIKGLNIHKTQVKNKRIKDLKQVKNFINSFDITDEVLNDKDINKFTQLVGYKLMFPFLCLKGPKINEKIKHLKIRTDSVPLCKMSLIPDQNRYHLDKLQERMEDIYCNLDLEKFMYFLSLYGESTDPYFRK